VLAFGLVALSMSWRQFACESRPDSIAGENQGRESGDEDLDVGQSPRRPLARTIVGRVLLETIIGNEVYEQDPGQIAAMAATVEDTSSGDVTRTDAAAEDPEEEDAPLFWGLAGDRVELSAANSPRTRISLWADGVELASTLGVESDGTYTLSLGFAPPQRSYLEIEVPDRLRAALALDFEQEVTWPYLVAPVALGYGFEASGSVVDERGVPVPGATLEARPLVPTTAGDAFETQDDEAPPWRVTSQADGTFAWDTLPAGPLRIWVDRIGYARTAFDVEVPARDLRLPIPLRFEINGEVSATFGQQMMANVDVRVEGSSLSPALRVHPQENGRFRVADLTDGVFAIEATLDFDGSAADGQHQRQSEQWASIPLENVRPDRSIHLVMLPAHQVRVQVKNATGQPIAGAQIQVFREKVGVLGRSCVSDESGVCLINALIDGKYWAFAQAISALPLEGQSFFVAAADTKLELTLSSPGHLSGTIVDERGVAVPGAKIALVSRSGGGLVAAPESLARPHVPAQNVAVNVDPRRAVVSDDGANPRLFVTDSVPDYQIQRGTASATMDSAQVLLLATSDASGAFELDGFLPGEYRVWIQHSAYAQPEPADFAWIAGEKLAPIQIVLYPGQTVSGRVMNDNGQPIAGAVVAVNGVNTASTDERGAFDLGRRRGRFEVRIWAQGYLGEVEELKIGKEPLVRDYRLESAQQRLVVRVSDRLGVALAQAHVEVREPQGKMPDFDDWTDASGVATFDALARGAVHLVVTHDDYAMVAREVKVDEANDLIEVALSRGFDLNVEVVDGRSREPIADCEVEVADLVHACDGEGRVEFRRLIAQRTFLQVQAPDYCPQRYTLEPEDLREGANGSVRLELVRSATLIGIVLDHEREPVARAAISLTLRDGSIVRTLSQKDGRFELRGVPDGESWIVVDPPAAADDWRSTSVKVFGRRQETTELDPIVLRRR
jgi:hypothetical protein